VLDEMTARLRLLAPTLALPLTLLGCSSNAPAASHSSNAPAAASHETLRGVTLADLPLRFRVGKGSPVLFGDQCLAENVLERDPTATVSRTSFSDPAVGGNFLGQIIVHTKDAERLYATLAERAATCGPDWRSASGNAIDDASSWWAAGNDDSFGPSYWVLARKGEDVLYLGGRPNGVPDERADVQSLAERAML
jgi:hypothetical protein